MPVSIPPLSTVPLLHFPSPILSAPLRPDNDVSKDALNQLAAAILLEEETNNLHKRKAESLSPSSDFDDGGEECGRPSNPTKKIRDMMSVHRLCE